MSRFDRRRDEGEEQRTTNLELFYDLVFVFGVTQVSHLLLTHLSWAGAGQSALVLLVLWWAWNYTTWVTNELDTDATAVRMLLLGLMLACLLMTVAIPRAFGGLGLLFAGSYVAIQVGRHLFLTFLAAEPGTIARERGGRILTWFIGAGVLWIIGAIAHGSTRTVLWLLALLIDYSAPLTLYWLPGRPRLDGDTWEVETGHFAERFQLFVIIALGESVVGTGATATGMQLTTGRVLALIAAFAVTASLWWLYFNYVAGIAERRLAQAEDRTRLARDGYTYLHAVMIAGVIVSAVGNELVIAHPAQVPGAAQLMAIAGGPALYLLAQVLFRLRLAGSVSGRRSAGMLLCAALGFAGLMIPALALEGLIVFVLVGVIALEQLASVRRQARGEPSPLELLESPAESV